MNLSGLFIKRPVTTTLVMLGIIVFGAMAYRQLPVSDLPTIDFPTINVNAGMPGASPETMASAVALPLEKQFASIAGLNSINSTSSLGRSNIVLQFDLSRNIDAAAQDVQSMIARAQRQLPPQMPAPPSFQKVNPGDQPVMMLVLRSATMPMATLDEYAESTLAQRISMVNGVAQVQVQGAAKYAVRIDVDPRKLSAHAIGIDEVATAIGNGNVNLPTGTMFGPDKTFTVLANGQLMKAADYGPMDFDPRLGRGRQVYADADDRAGRRGDLPLPAKRVGDNHPQPCAPWVDHRDVRRDVHAELQPGQPVPDGADLVGRLRRRRRH